MEMLQQIFMTAVAAFVFFILITKIASAVTNGDRSKTHDSSKLLGEELKSKTEKSSSKSKKKVRFAVDHDAFVVNKVVAGPSETKQVVLEKNHDDVGSLVKSPEEGFHDDHENEKPDNNTRKESVIDYDQTQEGKNESVQIIDKENVGNDNEDGMRMKLLCDDGIDEDEKEKEGLISDEEDSDDEDDWEGVERSDLEKVFGMAADYGKVDDHLQSLGSDIQMQLYGLHKVATEGPCREPQPMALKLSARAKWNAWQKLGNMNPDMAMEQYITLLSDKLPEWRTICCRKGEMESCSDVADLTGVSDSVNKDQQ